LIRRGGALFWGGGVHNNGIRYDDFYRSRTLVQGFFTEQFYRRILIIIRIGYFEYPMTFNQNPHPRSFRIEKNTVPILDSRHQISPYQQ
jgi:hypothetical protein